MTQIALRRKISLRIIGGTFVFLVWLFLPAVIDSRIAENVTIGSVLALSVIVFLHERFRIISIERKEK